MTHPSQDSLLLFAYGELSAADAADVETHLAQCAACHEAFSGLERARVVVEWTAPATRRRIGRRTVTISLAAAAVLALVLLNRPDEPPGRREAWRPTAAWSNTAGYMAGGPTLIEIDAQLTRLEQEKDYGFPN
jgi:anti-sigma factor RsiW